MVDYAIDYLKGAPEYPSDAVVDPVITWAQETMALRGYIIRELEVGIVNRAMLDQCEVYRSHHGLPLTRKIDAALLDALADPAKVFPDNSGP